ncbi:MAG TPA: PilZ domain-containing protein [Gammaproteobacteria bacterium]
MSTASRNYDEKRDFIRMTVDCALTLREVEGGRQYAGRCVNLSSTGAMVLFDEPPTMGQRLELHIEPRLALVPALDALVEVVRVLPAADGGFEVGMSIVEMR